ncbi:PREDICTED: corticosteroid-binding globulin [Ceratotherium simum simum]|uniref:Corticosteroid-binding globulin n=1 Tax=Ceratotherium simum simum TaxID=73337 RepID=A0ABM0HUK2_CERSS|nr:PREDICTED: corticosteroid-binding globulin [Ceratotherium simum simum]
MDTSKHDQNLDQHSPLPNITPNLADLAFSLYRELAHQSNTTNTFFSPVSIAIAFVMLSPGTKGDTHIQIPQGLNFNFKETVQTDIHKGLQHLLDSLNQPDDELQLTTSNILLIDENLKQVHKFLEDVKRLFHSDALATDFQDWARARRQINEYLKNKTQGKIVDLFSELDSPALLILVNYIFFKGTWVHPFNQKRTREENFYMNETTVMKVPMMFQSRAIKYLNDPVLPCRLVQLDYTHNGTVFFVLPDEGKIDTVITALSRDTIQRWGESLTRRHLNLYIPKVSISGACDLGDILRDLGIADLHNNKADFSGITREASVSTPLKVLHQSRLQLDEKGARANAPAAITAHAVSEPLTVRFDRPFLLLVFDHFTWSSLFLIKVVNPT